MEEIYAVVQKCRGLWSNECHETFRSSVEYQRQKILRYNLRPGVITWAIPRTYGGEQLGAARWDNHPKGGKLQSRNDAIDIPNFELGGFKVKLLAIIAAPARMSPSSLTTTLKFRAEDPGDLFK